MGIFKYGYPDSTPLDEAKTDALRKASRELGDNKGQINVEDVTTDEHRANDELLIRVSVNSEDEAIGRGVEATD
jgi:hypothetical protein